jgi:predicted metal-dependent phosphoesterase TrpH
VKEARNVRNRRILEKLNDRGIPITWDEVAELAENELIGRPHIARALVMRGACPTVRDAFTCHLGTRGPAYVRRHLPLPSEAIRTIHSAGGVAVWSHPLGMSRRTAARTRQVARHLQKVGLDGIEAYYSDHTPTQQQTALDIAEELGLLVSGGSDFHGGHVPDIHLGSGRGDLAVPDALLTPIERRAALHAGQMPKSTGKV